jgi:hypothetical protein
MGAGSLYEQTVQLLVQSRPRNGPSESEIGGVDSVAAYFWPSLPVRQ